MVDQGIAPGGRCSDAASYSQGLAVLMVAAVVLALAARLWVARGQPQAGTTSTDRNHPAAVPLAYAAHLSALGAVRNLAATPFTMALNMFLAGVRSNVQRPAATPALSVTFGELRDVVEPRG
ncbi:hypothetical protein [Fluviibacterium sp. S390]|uniref:hypothetical protein n=1 Tax=Fluviibacterium sp. S390 TaxID=3415139 RepID=UPI003C7E1C3B